MKRRRYYTDDGREVVLLRPENARDRALLEAAQRDPETRLDAEHSLGDTLGEVEDDEDGEGAPDD